ncbi:MAG: hypothetical protein HQL44_04525 [Alphaproteobacteria bacterium]|nr:hypothetical protein [Alphaproteobacteria bacterium]
MGFVILFGTIFALAAFWLVYSLAHSYLQGVINPAWLTPSFLVLLILNSSFALVGKGPRKEIAALTSLPFVYLAALYLFFSELVPYILDPNTATGGWAFALSAIPSFLIHWIMYLEQKLKKSRDSEDQSIARE